MTLFRVVSHTFLVVGLLVALGCNSDDEKDPPTPTPTCTDGVANQNETDIDCGGSCEPCARGQACLEDVDCDGELICVDNICVRATCNDGLQNQGETDLDCGGPNCGGCPLGGDCVEDSDCLAGTCQSGTCATSGAAMTEEQLCAMYYYSGNATDSLCMQRNLGSAQDYDPDALEYGCRPGSSGRRWAVSFLAAVNDSRITVDWTAAEECLSAARHFRYTHPAITLVNNPQWDTIANVTCKTFFSGALNAGDKCLEDWDCPENMGCYTTTPGDADTASWANGTATCQALASESDPCSVEFHPCGKALRCDEELATPVCVALKANGDSCVSDSECGSGWCDYDYEECAESPYKDAGEPCSDAEECVGTCLTCRPSEPGGQSICQALGGDGAYCRDWYDCLDDLGCVENVCGTVDEGARCGALNQGMCAPGFSCVPPVNCYQYDGDQTACMENDEFCMFDDYYGYCDPVAGDCLQLPGEGEACMFDLYCAGGTYCNPTSLTCTKLGEQGDSCGDTAPCNEDLGYSCNGTCVRYCEYREDCDNGYYCWSGDDSTPPQCMPSSGENEDCASHASCDPGLFCDLPGTHCFKYDYGASDPVEALNACGADAGSGDPECAFLLEAGSCEPADECVDHLSEGECTPDENCQWAETGDCDFPDCMNLDQGTCTSLGTGSIDFCYWDADAESCYPGCWAFDDTDEETCVSNDANLPCYWDGGMGWCMNSCGDFDNTDATTCENGTGGVCIYTPGDFACFANGDAQDCTASPSCDEGDCTAEYSACVSIETHPCAWTGTAYCDRADWEASGTCLPERAVGDNCIPDNVESMGPSPSDDATECASGYAIQDPNNEVEYTCSARPTNPVNGCNFVNETTAALINTVFAFGGFWIWGRRARRRKMDDE